MHVELFGFSIECGDKRNLDTNLVCGIQDSIQRIDQQVGGYTLALLRDIYRELAYAGRGDGVLGQSFLDGSGCSRESDTGGAQAVITRPLLSTATKHLATFRSSFWRA